MPKQRTKANKKLPPRWRKKSNAYYYRVPVGLEYMWDDKTEFRLGKTLAEAYVSYAERIQNPKPVNKMSDLMEQYQNTVTATQKPATRRTKEHSYRLMLPVIGHLKPEDITPVVVNEIMDRLKAKRSQSIARLTYSYLSHLFTKAIDWGIIEIHPMKGRVAKPKANKRTRYVEDWELAEALKVAPDTIKAHLYLKMVSGLRRSDVLTIRTNAIFRTPLHARRLAKHPEQITIDDLHNNGLRIQPVKTQDSSGKVNLIQWQPQLVNAVKFALSINPCMNPEYLILTKRCECYMDLEEGTASGFDSLWQRWQAKAIKETQLTEKFQERDIRAKVASDLDLQHASKLLAHTTEQITETVYRRKGEMVEPATIDSEILKYLEAETE